MSGLDLREIKVKCIRCPKGCDVRVKLYGEEILEIKGNECPIGKEYAKQEAKTPKRVIFTTIKIVGAKYPRLPVRTKEPIPKEKIFEAISEVKNVIIEAPVRMGEIILRDAAGTGVPFIAERSMKRVEENGRSNERSEGKV